jgi:hypothetical protein
VTAEATFVEDQVRERHPIPEFRRSIADTSANWVRGSCVAHSPGRLAELRLEKAIK